MDEIELKIEQYEKMISDVIRHKLLLSVSAYDSNRTSQKLKQALLRCHDILMTDQQIIHLSNVGV
ncbi:DEAD/DEAH box helicase family protein [Peribacillus glennii]|uniref:hypothetical protein n=1 Tax=Peribacillus glennii TaxID=2303991 RepID=UPI0018F165C3|nr:hypothetical protein [Peribacillus glennii]